MLDLFEIFIIIVLKEFRFYAAIHMYCLKSRRKMSLLSQTVAGSWYDSSGISTFSILALVVSIFNLASLVVNTSNNNNNQNNNVNSNQGNGNGAQNSASNANSDSATVNQVMLVPPGVGRRKRDANAPCRLELTKTKEGFLRLSLDKDYVVHNFSIEDIYFKESMALGAVYLMQSLLKANNTPDMTQVVKECQEFGSGAELVCSFVVKVLMSLR